MLLLQEKDEGIFFNQKLIFFRLKKGEWLIFQSRKDFIPFNKLSLYWIKKKINLMDSTSTSWGHLNQYEKMVGLKAQIGPVQSLSN